MIHPIYKWFIFCTSCEWTENATEPTKPWLTSWYFKFPTKKCWENLHDPHFYWKAYGFQQIFVSKNHPNVIKDKNSHSEWLCDSQELLKYLWLKIPWDFVLLVAQVIVADNKGNLGFYNLIQDLVDLVCSGGRGHFFNQFLSFFHSEQQTGSFKTSKHGFVWKCWVNIPNEIASRYWKTG